MELEYKQVQGTQAEKPLEFEVGLTTVYYRKNIIKMVEAVGENSYETWQYEEATLPLRTWISEQYKLEGK